MSCLATKQVELCNCSEPRFPINSSACFSLEQSKSNLFHHFLLISVLPFPNLGKDTACTDFERI